ncbi:MAG: hypothetical protein ACLGGU_04210, partial [Gammaproteobacteria bacterium]
MIRLALTPGEPSGIGPDLCAQIAQQTFDVQGRAPAKGSTSVAGGPLLRVPAPATLGRPAR